MNAFEMAMNTVKRSSHTYTNIQGLRLFIIMLEVKINFPLFFNKKNN